MQRLRVGVLMGGKSIEREVSLNSGRTICDHLDTAFYRVIPIFQTRDGRLYVLPWRFLHRGKISDFEHRLIREAQEIRWDTLKDTIDFMYIALHGRYGEDGIVQGFLEVLNIPYLGSKVFASALGMDKPMQKIFLTAAGITVPRGITIAPHELATYEKAPQQLAQRLQAAGLSFPLIVKPAREGSSFGVAKAGSIEELIAALAKSIAITADRNQPLIIEEVIEGMEFSCIVITDPETGTLMPLPPTEIEIEAGSSIFDYEQKYMPGRATKHTPARCSDETIAAIQATSVRVMEILGFRTLGRIDGFVRADGAIVITDPNSFSGMAPSSYAFLQAAEINMTHTGFINHLIKTELQAYGMERIPSLDQTAGHHNQTGSHTKIRVGVLLGGASNEREISLESGRNVCYKLSPHTYEVTPIFVDRSLKLFKLNQRLLVRNSTQEIAEGVDHLDALAWSDLATHFDFIFLGLHGGAGENGSIQGTLEMLGLPYNGSPVLPSALCMDKYKTNEFLHNHGFAIPRHVLVDQKSWVASGTEHRCPLAFPVIVKPHDDGCSVMVQKITTHDAFVTAVETIFTHGKEAALIEECIEGTEVTTGVIGNEHPYALPPSQSIAARGILSIEEKFLPGAGENQTPALLPDQAIRLIQRTMEDVYAAVGCKGYARIDAFYQSAEQSPTGKERVVILEINTLPGLTPATCIFHQAAEIGIKPMDFIDLIVKLGLEYHTQKIHLSSEQRNLLEKTN